ncbi:hypothetical protein HYV43_05295 [Candidatus Micrarchaeota archaeon]|nr:hypothetical protein [Candidatus Micrarchaeota archaeon]
MDVRRIQKTGRNTFIVSLPKSWADAKRVRQGTAAHVEQLPDGALRVDVQGQPAARSAAVDADGPQALRAVISAYVAGAEHIVLNGKAAAELAEAARQHLAAVEGVAEAPRQVTLRVYASGQEYVLSTLLRRMHAVNRSLFDAAEAAFSKPAEAAATAERREREANRWYTLALRGMGTGGGASGRFEALAANALENVADELEQFVAEGPRHSKALLAQVRAAYEQAAGEFFDGKTGEAASEAQEALAADLAALRRKSALEWARLSDILRYCMEWEDTAADLAAVKELESGVEGSSMLKEPAGGRPPAKGTKGLRQNAP